jgi:hypothetical protein
VIGERFLEHVAGVVDEDWGGVTVVGEADEGEREGPAAGAVLGDVVDVEGGTEGGAGLEGCVGFSADGRGGGRFGGGRFRMHGSLRGATWLDR